MAKFVRIPTSQTPGKVFEIGAEGGPVRDPKHLMELTGAKTPEEAFSVVQDIGQEEARKLGVRLPGTERLFPDDPREADVLTPEMLNQTELQMPTGELADTGVGALDTSKGLQGQFDFFQQQTEQLQKELEEARKEQKGVVTGIKDFFTQRQSQAAILTEQQKELGIPTNLAQINTLIQDTIPLQDQLNTLTAQRDQSMLAQEGIPGLTISEVTGRKARIERQANSRINAVAATLNAKNSTIAALQGNISLARSLAKDAVTAAMADQQFEFDQLQTFFDINKDIIDKLDTKAQNALNNTLDVQRDILEQTKKEEDEKAELMVKAAQVGVNINIIGKTLDEVKAEYAELVAPLASEERELQLAAERAGIALTNAQAVKALRRDPDDPDVRVYEDDELRAVIRGLQGQDRTYQEVLDEVTLSQNIINKDRARLITAEQFDEPVPQNLLPPSPQQPSTTSFDPYGGLDPDRILTETPEALAEEAAEKRGREAGKQFFLSPGDGLPELVSPTFN